MKSASKKIPPNDVEAYLKTVPVQAVTALHLPPINSGIACSCSSGWKPSSPASSTDGRNAPSVAASILLSFTGESRRPTSRSTGSLTLLRRDRSAWRTSRQCGIKPLPMRSARSLRSTVQAIRASVLTCSRRSPARPVNGYGSMMAATAATICALAQRVEVADDEVRIMGSKSELLRTLVAGSSVPSAVFGVLK